MSDSNLQEAFQDWEKLSDDKKNWFAYESRLKVVLDDFAAEREAELNREEAWQKGLEEGREKGRVKGKEEGREEGREKGQTEIVKRMLEKGVDVKTISDLTGVSIEKIEEIRKPF